jgi:phosphohistidine phosphatase
MKVFFLRHGIAADRDEWNGADADRPLTPEGRERMESEAEAIDKLNIRLRSIVTSPLLRAKETAEIVARRLKMRDALVEDDRLSADQFNTSRFARLYAEHQDAGDIMLVGHEPSFSETIGQLIGGGRVTLKKGGLACVEITTASSLEGTLLWLLPPKALL